MNFFKSLFKTIVIFVVKRDFLWHLIRPFITLSKVVESHRKSYDKKYLELSQKFEVILEDPVVKNGPLKGLIYPGFISYGSSIYPKIIGSYERELHPTLFEIIYSKFNNIIDIGSAEGYYAVGLAKKSPNSKIIAFDIKQEANKLCKKLATLNNVENRILIQQKCDSNWLLKYKFTVNDLIICDCEGYEKELFTKKNIENLRNTTLLIEVHDFVDLTISNFLQDLFRSTHNLKKNNSISDIEKAKTYNYPGTDILTLNEKQILFAENRPGIMEWFYFTPL
jgi:23S rRNA U2552 (ribose-2'-O)-methylase RlmE/FtsJ